MDTQELARRVRAHSVKMVYSGKSSHIGSALSMVDILAVLYGEVLNVSPTTASDINRDYFILSKGHGGASLYATLAECGFIEVSELAKHYQNGSPYSGHVSHKGIPGVELSTGSLGHGLPVAVGLALSAKLDDRKSKVYVLVGDGEIMEGANWEALMFASHHNLDNLTILIDRNRLQSFKDTELTIALEPLDRKLEAFGACVFDIDGHNHRDLIQVLSEQTTEQPKAIIANTIKGKGISYMENKVLWHYKFPDDAQLKQALMEIEDGIKR